MQAKPLTTEEEYIPAKPTSIAMAGGIPVSLAASLLKSGTLTLHQPFHYSRAKHVRRTDVEQEAMRVLQGMHLPEIFETLGFDGPIPLLPAWEDGDGYLHVYCKWCREFHHHGRGEGSRSPHCDWNSPWKRAGGYELVRVGRWTPEIRREAPPFRSSQAS